jgi:hypothetical protein
MQTLTCRDYASLVDKMIVRVTRELYRQGQFAKPIRKWSYTAKRNFARHLGLFKPLPIKIDREVRPFLGI